MPKYTVRETGEKVDLNKNNFKATGGEGNIHIIDDMVYKICHPGKMIPEEKFQELSVLNHPQIIRPEHVLLDSKNASVGYTMRKVPGNGVPLAQILSKTYREREGISHETFANLVKNIAAGLRFIHQHPGYLQVDGNELNYMVSDHKEVYFIDVNSFQTPHYPADAIMPSIRDWNCPKNASGIYQWSQLTDAYSFAIISFYMFTAFHPFKGRHPQFTNLKTLMVDQMKACKSVLDPEVSFPQAACYFPFESVIPGGATGAYMQWYRALFCENKRLPIPQDFQDVVVLAIQIREIIGSNNFDIHELKMFDAPIVGYYAHAGRTVVITTKSIYCDNQSDAKPNVKFHIGFAPISGVPIMAWLEDGYVKLKNLDTKQLIHCEYIQGNTITVYDGRLYVLGHSHIFEINFIEKGAVYAMAKVVANIMPTSTELFQGVAFQNMFGVKMASLFMRPSQHVIVRINELTDISIIDAKFESNVLMAIGLDGESGQYNRYIFRFSQNGDSYDVRIVEDIHPNGLNFTVLDNKITVCLTEEEKIEIFSSHKDASSLKSFTDPAIKADMHLCHNRLQVQFARSNKLYSISVKK